ncbi:MAG: hypothetical protein IJS88_00220 [Alphaproteobacteria bacterium]|nr:hypothetical protein [Alphaproteobacteria bacterium]
MDKTELKQTLITQFIPLDEAAQKKLDYLQSDDVFTDNQYVLEEDTNKEIGNKDDSLMNAFAATVNSVAPHTQHQPQISEYHPQPATSSSQQQTNQPSATASDSRSIAARIAALRGISMPGDYLKRKS